MQNDLCRYNRSKEAWRSSNEAERNRRLSSTTLADLKVIQVLLKMKDLEKGNTYQVLEVY